MIYLVTELRLEGGGGVGNDSDFAADGAGITDERAGAGSWLIVDILEPCASGFTSNQKRRLFFP